MEINASIIDLLDEVPLWSAPFGWKLLDAVDYRKNITALDIGFGTGFPMIELAMRLGKSSVVYGIDPWVEAAERAKKRIDLYGISNIRMLQGEAESIPLADSSVNLITSNNGINNVRCMEDVFSECARISSRGGQFVQTMNLDKSMVEFYSAFEKVLLQLNMSREIELMHQHIYEKRKPLDEMIRITEKSGFTISNLQQHQFNYRFADADALFNHFFIKLAFKSSWEKLVHEHVEEVFKRTADMMNKQGAINLSIPFVVINAYRN